MLRQYDYKRIIKGDDPVLYCPLDDTTGTSAAELLRGNDGTYTNSPTLNDTALLNYEGAAPDFIAASSQHVVFGSGVVEGLIDGASVVSAELWFVADVQDSEDDIFRVDIDGTGVGIALSITATGVKVRAKSVTGDTAQEGTYTVTLSGIYHFVAVVDYPNDKIYGYLNGVQVIDYSATFTNTSYTNGTPTNPARVASSPAGTQYFDGHVGHVAVYDHALTSEQIAFHYWVGKKRVMTDYDVKIYEDSPTFYYKLQDLNSIAKDECGNQDGTYIGSIGRRSDPLMPGLDHGGATFDGQSGNYINCGDSSLFPTGAMTVECIVVLLDRSISTDRNLVTKWGTSSQNTFSLYTFSTTGCLASAVSVDGAATKTAISSSENERMCAHVTMVFVPSTSITLYKNGEQIYQDTTSVPASIFNGTEPLLIGGYDEAGTFLGTIQNVAIYSHALSADRIYRHFLAANYTADDYATTVLAADPGAFWRFDDISGTTLTDAKLLNKVNGTMAGSPTLAQRGMLVGDTNASIYFDGTDDLVTFGSTDFAYERTDPFSVVAIIRSATAVSRGIAGKYDGTSGWYFYMASDGVLRIFLRNTATTNDIQVQTTGAFDDGGEHVVAVSYDGSSKAEGVTFYVNGVREVSTITYDNLTSSIANSANFMIGAYDNAGTQHPFEGWMDEVQIYDYEMSPTQVWKNYVLARKAYSYDYYKLILSHPSVEGYWPIDEITGTSIADDTGSGFTGTANAPYTLNEGRITDMPNSKDNSIRFAYTQPGDPGTPGYIGIPYTGIMQNIEQSDFSMEAWALPTNPPVDDDYNPQFGIMMKNGYHIGMYFQRAGRLQAITYNSANTAFSAVMSTAAEFEVDVDIGIHCVWTLDWTRGFSKLYMNGLLAAVKDMGTGQTPKVLTEPWEIGRADSVGIKMPMHGRISHVSLYSDVLTPEEVYEHYLAGRGRLVV